MILRAATPADAPALCALYNPYVRQSTITFEEAEVAPREMALRLANTLLSHPWLVAEAGDRILGYAYATPWKTRSAYRFASETTIYLAQEEVGKGLGTRLYGQLLTELRARGMHRAIGGIALPNPASVALHERLGFRKVAEFSEVGWKFDRWIPVGYWELPL